MSETSIAQLPDAGDAAFSQRTVSVACAIYLVGYAGYSFGDTFEAFRYLVYAVPPLLLGSLLFQRAPMTNKAAIAFLVAYVILAFASNNLGGGKGGEFLLRNVVIIILIIATFVPVVHVSAGQIRIVFLCSVVYLVLAYLQAGSGSIRLLRILQSGTASAFDAGFDDNQGGLVGPVYAVFMYATGSKLNFIIAVVMSLLGGKRVGVIAIVVGMLAATLFARLTVLKPRRNRFIVLFLSLATINIVSANLTAIVEYIHERFDLGVSVEEVMLGRFEIGSDMNRAMNARPFAESIFGSGPGSADRFASIVSGGVLTQPHNDWMKILYDYGIVGSLVMTTFLALMFSTSAIAAVIALTSAIMMCTDNVLIYLFYQFPAVLMVAYAGLQDASARGTAGRLRR